MGVTPGSVLLGTVALEPNRWRTVDRSGAPSTEVAPLLPAIAAAGFDGIELWERHLDDAVAAGPLPISVLNSYVTFDEADPSTRDAVTAEVARCGAGGVKFNVGPDSSLVDAYGERVAAWRDTLPDTVALLCECHVGISVAEDPAVAARILDRAGPPDRVQAIVHTHEGADHLRARFDAYGDRITHVHVNHLDQEKMTAPTLASRRAGLEATVALLGDLGFAGSWTIEFVAGLLTERDRADLLLEQAVADLAVLRDVLAATP